ncbi:MAG: putative glycoside hydrolase [Clostridiales bacterium]|nr:putative glycoside hydrolase [Clostridiales bacterium]
MKKDEQSNRKLKGYYKFSKKYPTARGTTYAIGESRKMKKKERNNKILLVVSMILIFVIAFITASVCFTLSRRPIEDSNASNEKRLSSDNFGTIRAVYISNEIIKRDADLENALDNAVKNGMNAVMLDFKDRDGDVLYPSRTAVSPMSDGKNAIEKDTLKIIHKANLMVIARVYCFEDSIAPQKLSAYVYSDAEKNTIWFDKAPALGGRVWLDPSNEKAQSYLCGIISEVSNMGADAIYLQSVRFPVSKTLKPVFDEDTNRNELLMNFIDSAVASSDCSVILGTEMSAIDGSDTEKYGGSLFDTAAAACSPLIKRTDNYTTSVANEYNRLKEQAANNFSTINVIMTVHDSADNTGFYEELSAAGVDSYIIVP